MQLGDEWDYENLWDETLIARRDIGDHVIAIAGDPTGDVIALDYRVTVPAIALALHEEGYRTIRIAPSFATFLELLT